MTIDEKLDILLEHVCGVKQEVSGLKEDVSGLKQEVSGLKEEMSGLKQEVSGLKEDVSELKTRMTSLETRMTNVENTTSAVKFMLENETNVNIIRIAEGHIDLNRKLDQYYSIMQEQVAKNEKVDLYITSLRARVDAIMMA